MEDMVRTEYDGCGKCLVAVRRLSRKSDATSSPEKQADQIQRVVADIGGHVIAWADDWEVSGATNPLDRKEFGPWLRGELGPYDGIASASVDRVGRNVRDTLNTQELLTGQGRLIVTADHSGVWDFSDPTQENEWMIRAWGSQMELRAIQKRNRDETVRARAAGEPKQMNAYGFRYVRLVPMGKVDHVELDPESSAIIREVARRILTDESGTITAYTEAMRLTREGVLSPRDHRSVMYGREPKGTTWTGQSLVNILVGESALGYLMHGGRPVLGKNGQPVRLCEGLWDRPTRDRLIVATTPKTPTRPTKPRAPKGTRLLSGRGTCGNCKRTLKVGSRPESASYLCNGRVSGAPESTDCKPAPSIDSAQADKQVTEWFLARYGTGQVMRREYDPGTGYAARIADLQADRKRLRDDRTAGLYDDDDDAEWYRTEYARMGQEIKDLKTLPDRPAGMRMMPTGQTVAEAWHTARDDAARREMLNGYDVRVTLYPKGSRTRLEITGITLYEMAA